MQVFTDEAQMWQVASMQIDSTRCLEQLICFKTVLQVSRAAHLSGLELNLRIVLIEGHQRTMENPF